MSTKQPRASLRQLAESLHSVGLWAHATLPKLEISGIAYDSRQVQPGDLFVAIPGYHHDGGEYIGAALCSGAGAVVGQAPRPELPDDVPYLRVANARRALAELACALYHFPTRQLFTVGITGTKGKTSVAHLSAAVLGIAQTELISTVSNARRRGLSCTTPESPQIQQLAWQAWQSGHTHLILEVSAHALSLERVSGCHFDLAVFTNLSQDHFDYYAGFDEYLAAKLRLFQFLEPEATALVNGDDSYGRQVCQATRAQTLRFGLSARSDIWADELQLSPQGVRFLAHTPQGRLPLMSYFPGRLSVYNALAALGVGLVRGLSLAAIKTGIESVRRIAGRFERFRAISGQMVIIDFAHSPDSLEQAILALKPFYTRLITVFGCGGDSDPYKRPLMGAISGRLSDYTIITSDNPKEEDPQAIISQIAAGLAGLHYHYETIPDRRAAILRAFELSGPGEAILIAGKGHEETQIFADRVLPFNDRLFLLERGLIS